MHPLIAKLHVSRCVSSWVSKLPVSRSCIPWKLLDSWWWLHHLSSPDFSKFWNSPKSLYVCELSCWTLHSILLWCFWPKPTCFLFICWGGWTEDYTSEEKYPYLAIYVSVCVYACTYMCVCMCMCMCMCVCVHTCIQRKEVTALN